MFSFLSSKSYFCFGRDGDLMGNVFVKDRKSLCRVRVGESFEEEVVFRVFFWMQRVVFESCLVYSRCLLNRYVFWFFCLSVFLGFRFLILFFVGFFQFEYFFFIYVCVEIFKVEFCSERISLKMFDRKKKIEFLFRCYF